MAWNGNFRPYVSRPRDPLSFLYDCESFPGMEIKCLDRPPQPIVTTSNSNDNNDYRRTSGAQERKRRLRTDQIESLEKSFQEEIKLEPDRKMKLAQELNLEPRQVAVWFQNRRARWKAKQLERLYDALKEEFDAISREKQKLQEEVIKLRAELEDRTTKQGSTNYTEASAEETVDSTVVVRSSFKLQNNSYQQIAGCSYLFNVEDCNPPSPPYWGAWPGGCA